MRVTMIGTGYVGLVTGACFAEAGNDVVCLDIDTAKIARLRRGEVPIFEPGLEELIQRNTRDGRLQFTDSYDEALAGARCAFIAVGTPQGPDGSADLSGIFAVADALAQRLDRQCQVVIKSTVPVGTNRTVQRRLSEATGRAVHVASNPEFLREGAAIADFTKPDRVVIGADVDEALQPLRELYAPFVDARRPLLEMGLESAEMTKYVGNCFLATKISFINEMANLADSVGADIDDVRQGIGYDHRIGFAFLMPGVGYGGSCFPKDVRALQAVARSVGRPSRVLEAVDAANERQKHVLFEKIVRRFGSDLTGRRFAVWGLAFKPGTDDIREAPSLVLIRDLLRAGAEVVAHDPAAVENVRSHVRAWDAELRGAAERLRLEERDPLAAAEGADALVLVTEWPEYRQPNWADLADRMRQRCLFDGRNAWDRHAALAAGFEYTGIGRAGHHKPRS